METTYWQDLQRSKRMDHLLQTGHLSDCSFVLYDEDGKKVVIKCHKFVLISVSPVFERMFEGDFDESKDSQNIVLDDVSASDFMKFIKCLYCQEEPKNMDDYDMQMLQTLIYLSKKFMVTYLVTGCLRAICRRITKGMLADEVIDLYEYAHQIEDSSMIAFVQSKIFISPEIYVKATAIYDLGPELFAKFITELIPNVGEKTRFHIIERYCTTNGYVDCSKCPAKLMELNMVANESTDDPKKTASSELSLACDDKAQDELNIKETEPSDVEVQKSEEELLAEAKKKEFVEELLKAIKFTSMSSFEFSSGPGASNLLSWEKKFEILSQICIAEHKVRTFKLTSNPFGLNGL